MLNGLWGTEIREEVGINIKNESSLHNQIKAGMAKKMIGLKLEWETILLI